MTEACNAQPPLCCRERHYTDATSPGPVLDHEQVCRGAYAPNHGAGLSLVKASVVREKDLHQGSLSVWRVGGPHEFIIDDVVEKLSESGPANNALWKLLCPTAGQVRHLSGGRGLFCVLDDTDCGPEKPRHPAHAVIGLCHELGFSDLPLEVAQKNERFQEVKLSLVKLFRQHIGWANSSAS